MGKITNAVRKFFVDRYTGARSWMTGWLSPNEDTNWLAKYYGYVYACVSAIAEDVAMINFRVFRKQGDGTLLKVDRHPLLDLLDKPNPLMSKYQLLELTQTHIELAGEAFWYMELGEVTNKPKSFYLLPPDRMEVAVDDKSPLPKIKGYVFNKNDGTKIPLEPDEIVHFKMPNPWNQFRGYGTVEAGLVYIMTERYGSEFTRNYIYNNAMPAGIVSLKGNIPVDKFEEAKRQWKQEYGSINKAGKTAFLRDVDATFTKVGTGLDEIALKELKDMSRDDIMTMFRVSKPILGIFEDVNLASAKTAQYVFMSRVIDPKMSRMTDTLQNLLERWNIGTTIQYTLGYDSPVPEDTEAKISLFNAAIDNWMTINEIRDEEGLDPVDGGDVIHKPLNLMPIGEKPVDEQQKKHGVVTIKRTVRKTVSSSRDLDYERKENFRLEMVATQEQYAKRFHNEVNKLLDKQKRQILSNIKEETAKKVKKGTKAFEEFTFNDDEWDKIFEQRLTPIEYELLKQQGAIALAFAGAEELEFQLNEKVKKQVAARINRMARAFNDETKASLIKAVSEGFGNAESIGQITKRIEGVYKDAKGFRAERIARTETADASSAAATEAYAQTGYITKEEWFANPGACEFCEELNGQVVSLSENFVNLGDEVTTDNGGSYAVDYTDVGYPPLHPNCTCTVIPVRE